MVLPEEREADFRRKMQSPLFQEHFEKESWSLLFFDALRHAYTREHEDVGLEALYGVRSERPPAARVRESQQDLPGLSEET